MGGIFGNLTSMQLGNMLIAFGLLLLIVVLAVVLIAHFAESRRQQKLILSHIDGAVSEIRDAVVADGQSAAALRAPAAGSPSNGNTAENTAGDPTGDTEAAPALEVVKIDSRVKPRRETVRHLSIFRIDSRVLDADGGDAALETSAAVGFSPEQFIKELHASAESPAETLPKQLSTDAAADAGTENAGGADPKPVTAEEAAKPEETEDRKPAETGNPAEAEKPEAPEAIRTQESQAVRNVRYRSRDCGVDKNGNTYSIEQLRKQIQ